MPDAYHRIQIKYGYSQLQCTTKGGGTDQAAARPIIISKSKEQIKISD